LTVAVDIPTSHASSTREAEAPAPPVHRPGAERPVPLSRVLVVIGLFVTAWSAAALPARAEFDTRVTADEPQYLLTAISLGEDRSLDISDELRTRRWRAFHEAPLPQQTKPLDNARRVSPHDPLLPALLALPVALGGWVGAKLAMAMMAGLLAASTVWVAVRRFGVPLVTAALVVVGFSIVPPLSVYGTQIYPELPAALAVVILVGLLTGARAPRAIAWAAVVLALLPWLSIKYAPIVVAGGAWVAVVLVRERRTRALLTLVGIVAMSGVAFLLLHRALYGGWTAYAAGDHFTTGELSVAGRDPQLDARSVRLVNLFTDQRFGLLAWAPAFVVAVPALGALARRRPAGWSLVGALLMAGWLNATFVALTMHGWWWPGRQIVVVVPLLVLAVAWFVANAPWARWWRALLVATTAAGAFTWVWLLVEVLTGRRQLIIDFDQTTAPLYRAWRGALPDGQTWTGTDRAVLLAWVAVLAGLTAIGWRSMRRPRPSTPSTRSTLEVSQ